MNMFLLTRVYIMNTVMWYEKLGITHCVLHCRIVWVSREPELEIYSHSRLHHPINLEYIDAFVLDVRKNLLARASCLWVLKINNNDRRLCVVIRDGDIVDGKQVDTTARLDFNSVCKTTYVKARGISKTAHALHIVKYNNFDIIITLYYYFFTCCMQTKRWSLERTFLFRRILALRF